MIRSTSRVARAMVMALAAAAALLAASPPASAATTPMQRICEASGTFCIGSRALTPGSPVFESPGRSINLVQRPNDFLGDHEFWLQFNGDTSLCVGIDPSNHGVAVVQPCSNGTGVLWARGTYKNADLWVNVLDTNNNVDLLTQALSGIEASDSQYEIKTFLTGGTFQRFNSSPFK
jgi:hypothetical protein